MALTRKQINQRYYAAHRDQERDRVKKYRQSLSPEKKLQQGRRQTQNRDPNTLSFQKRIRGDYSRDYARRQRRAVVAYLGGKCSNLICRWLNFDGSTGCADPDMLHVDHPKGGGCKERKELGIYAFYNKVLQSKSGEYQLLCANCNFKKRWTNHEVGRFDLV
jgi:hypothetical protein